MEGWKNVWMEEWMHGWRDELRWGVGGYMDG